MLDIEWNTTMWPNNVLDVEAPPTSFLKKGPMIGQGLGPAIHNTWATQIFFEPD